MLGMQELKETIEITETTVECPVKGCGEKVQRQREVFRREEKFKCPKHNIYISPTTFEYQSEIDNILWKEKADLDLFDRIKSAKRESRIARDNSEDAVTWNVFRFLEKSELLSEFLAKLRNSSATNPEIIYWSYSRSQQNVWNELKKARTEFGEIPQRSTEPDLIVKSDDALFFIEAKLKASSKVDFNKRHTAEEKKERIRRYGRGDRFLKRPVEDIIDAGYYQLMRLWVIGSSIAERVNLEFYLVNLVLSGKEEDIERDFKRYIKEDQSRKFLRITWEDIYQHISSSVLSGREEDMIMRYFKNKTIGYENGKLQRAFSIP